MSDDRPKKIVAIVDGEHSPSVVESALKSISGNGSSVAALIFAGGTEKADPTRYPLDIPLVLEENLALSVISAIDTFTPEEIVDLSDDPVISQETREELVALVASRGIAYTGPGYRFESPRRPHISSLPTIAVIGTGKRTGKTAVCAAIARYLSEAGASPLIVTMGRGGPRQPVYIPPGSLPADPGALLNLANDGLHAASDYIEDALFTGLPSIGAWRCGGGFLGETGPNVVHEAVRLAQQKARETGSDLLLLEGSGASIPPVHADATVTVVPRQDLVTDDDKLVSHPFRGLGLYRLLIADAMVVTGCTPANREPNIVGLTDFIAEWKRQIDVVYTSFELKPQKPVEGRRVALATTATESAVGHFKHQLEKDYGATVVGISTNLSRPRLLEKDLSRLLSEVEILLVELKARAVDLAARKAIASGVEVVFVENRPQAIGDGDRLATLCSRLIDIALSRLESPDRE